MHSSIRTAKKHSKIQWQIPTLHTEYCCVSI